MKHHTTGRHDAPQERRRQIASISGTLEDGTIYETTYDRVARTTDFVVSKDGEWRTEQTLTLPNGQVLVPYSSHNNLLTHGVVLLASQASEYGSKQDLLQAIQEFIHRYVDLTPVYESIAAHYVVLSWLSDAYQEIPYLRVKGEPGCGKTRFLLTVGSLCYKPIFASGASTVSPLFRMLDSIRGTLVLDEADFRFSDARAEVTKILNNGTAQGFPVLRAEANLKTGEFDPRAFHVYGPKLVATRGPFEDPALESRFISESLGHGRMREGIPISLAASHRKEALRLRNQLLLYRLRNLGDAASAEKPADLALDPRLNQMFGPLLSIIDDLELRRQVLAVAVAYHTQIAADRGLEVEALILARIRDLWQSNGHLPTVKDVASALAVINASDFHEPVTPRWVGQRIRRRLGLATVRRGEGYIIAPTEGAKLTSLFERYGLREAPHP